MGFEPSNPMDAGKMDTTLSPSDVKPLVVVESRYAGDIPRNEAYARAAVRDCILRGEVPLASHLLYTQPGILRDDVPEERELGMGLGWHAMRRANYVVVYGDLGFSSGMVRGCVAAIAAGKRIKLRFLKIEPWFSMAPPAPSGPELLPLEILRQLEVED